MSELKPCPFCGGEGDWYEVKPGYGYVSCDTCDATIGCFDALPKQDAIDAWNTRVKPGDDKSLTQLRGEGGGVDDSLAIP